MKVFKGISDKKNSVLDISLNLGKKMGLKLEKKKGLLLSSRTPIQYIK